MYIDLAAIPFVMIGVSNATHSWVVIAVTAVAPTFGGLLGSSMIRRSLGYHRRPNSEMLQPVSL